MNISITKKVIITTISLKKVTFGKGTPDRYNDLLRTLESNVTFRDNMAGCYEDFDRVRN